MPSPSRAPATAGDALQYPLGDALPAPGDALDVAPGVRWLRMPLPFALDHINLWLLRDRDAAGDGWTIVDCGIDDAPTRAAWERVFAHALGGLPVRRVVVTHLHPDHLGLAHWLTARFDCPLAISATDWHAARLALAAPSGFGGDGAAAFFARHGLVDAGALDQVRARRGHYASLVPAVPAQYQRLLDGATLDVGGTAWRCIAGHGHAPEHIALHAPALGDTGVLIAGDMLLPRISTNVSVYESEPEADPLPLFLRSLDAMRALPAATLVLPSHGRPFVGAHARIAQLEAHHAERLDELLAACRAAPFSAADALPVLFRRPLDLHQTTFAMGEAIAHLHALRSAGRVRAVDGADGVRRFAAT